MSCYYTFVERYILWRALSLFAMSVRGAHERGHPSSSYATICHELLNAYVRVLFCAAYSACSACLVLASTVRALYACIALHVYMYIRSLILLLLRGTNLLVCYRAIVPSPNLEPIPSWIDLRTINTIPHQSLVVRSGLVVVHCSKPSCLVQRSPWLLAVRSFSSYRIRRLELRITRNRSIRRSLSSW
jgi:hypothetical protein